jgi:hypothetical protein
MSHPAMLISIKQGLTEEAKLWSFEPPQIAAGVYVHRFRPSKN